MTFSCFRIRRSGLALAVALVGAGLSHQSVHAADFVWTNTAATATATAGSSWSTGVAPPAPGDSTASFIITNDLSAGSIAALNASYNLANLIATNSGVALRTITIFNGQTVAVSNTTVIGSNTLLNVGSNTTGGSSFSNNDLFLLDNAQINFFGSGPAAAGTLTVAGTFGNSSASVIQAAGAAYLNFSSASALITNAGLMNFFQTLGANGNQQLTLLVGANSNAFLHNSGTLILGTGASTAGARVFAISNQFANLATGWLVITSDTSSATGGSTPNVVFTGSSGGAATNAGMVRLVSTALRQSAGTLTFLNGDFVNLGTLTWQQITNLTASFTLAEAGAVFSNTVGGQVITEAGGTGTFAIRADRHVNLGTHQLNAGTLQFQTAAAGVGVLDNSGTILFNGGFLNVGTLTNTVSGVISNTQAAGGTMVWVSGNTLQNFGLIHSGNGVLTNAGAIFLNGGSSLLGSLTNIASGSLVFSNGTATFAATLANGGAVLAARGSTNSITGFAWNGGTVTVTNSVLAFTGGGFNGNILNLQGGGVLNIGGTDQASANASFGTFTNVGTVNFNLVGGGTLNASTNGVGILNQGTLLLINNNSGAAINAAVINATATSYLGFQLGANNAMTFTVHSVATNYGTLYVFNVNEGLIINNGGVFNGGTITVGNGGSISMPGALINTGVVNLVGLIPRLFASSVFNETNGLVTLVITHVNGQNAAFGSIITNAGVIKLTRTATEGTGSSFQPDFGSTASPTPIDNTGTLISHWAGVSSNLLSATLPLSWLNGRVTNGPTGFIASSNGAVFVMSGLAQNQGTIQVEPDSIFATSFTSRSPTAGRGNPGNWDVGTSGTANDGVVVLNGGYFGASVFSNNPGAQLTGSGTVGRVTFSNNWDLAGGFGFVVTPATIVNAGLIAPTGVFNAGNISNLPGGAIIGAGLIESRVVTNLITGSTSFNANGRIFNAAGATVLASGGTLVLGNGFFNDLNAGTIGATNAAVLQLGDGTLPLNNDGTIALLGGELRSGNLQNNSNIVMRSGTTALTVAGTLVNASSGTWLVTNTTATVTGLVTNEGALHVVDGTVNFQNALHVAGTLTLRNGFITGPAAKTVAGQLAGNGAVVGNLTVETGGTLAPGFSLGTMVFSNDLTLAGTYAVDLSDAGGSGNADFIQVFGTLDISGATLSFTALDTTTNAVYVLAQYGALAGGAFATVSGLPAEFTLDYNYNSLNQIALITTIPEPSSLVLVGLGLIGLLMVRRPRKVTGGVLGVALLGASLSGPTARAADFVWTNTAATATATAGSSWSTGVAPMAPGDFTASFIITNDLSAGSIAALNASYDVANLIATNSGVALRTITIFNGQTVAVSNTTVIGSNTLLNVGSNTTGGSSFSNNDLFLLDNAQINFFSSGPAAAGTLTVAGTFGNSSASVIQAAGATYLNFSSASAVITNAGLMNFFQTLGASTNQQLTLLVGANSNAFLHNSGTLILGTGASTAGARVFAISNQFANLATGWLVITSDTSSATAGSTPNVVFTGSTRSSGGAATNAGTVRLVSTALRQSAGTLTFLNGDFVNLGTLTWQQITNLTASFTLAEAGAVFSNTVGGQVITEAGGIGTFAIRADRHVNLGTHQLNAGTLQFQTATAGVGVLDNSGTILFNGGFLNVGTLTNTVSGVISNSQPAGGTMLWGNTLHNYGLIHTGSGMLTNAGTIFMNAGAVFGGALTNTAGSSLIFSNGTATFDGTLANRGTVLAARGYTNTITGFVRNEGTIVVSNAATVLAFADGAFNAGTIHLKNNSAELYIGGATQLTANNSGKTLTNAAGATIQLGVLGAGNGGTGGAIYGATNAVGLLNQGLLTIPNINPNPVVAVIDAAVINDVGGTIFVGGAANSVTITSLSTNRGAITLAGNVSATVAIANGDVVNEGVITLTGAMNFTVPGWIYNSSNITWNTSASGGTFGGGAGIVNEAGATFNIINAFNSGAGKTISTVFSNFGILTLSRPTMQNSGSPHPVVTGLGSIYNTGVAQVTWLEPSLLTGTNTLTYINAQFTNAVGGLLSVSNGAIFSVENVLRNSGTIRVETNSVFVAGGQLGYTGLGKMTLGSGTLANDGTIELRGGVDYSALLAVNVLSNAPGSVLLGNGEVGRVTLTNLPTLRRIVAVRDIVNLGTIMPDGVLNARNITNASGGVIIGYGTIQSLNTTNDSTGTTYELANGRIFNAAGATVLASGGTLVLSNGFFNDLNAGTVGATNNGILQFGDGTLPLNNAGTIALLGGELRTGHLQNNNAIVMSSGLTALSVAGTLVNASSGTWLVTNTTATVTGLVTNEGALHVVDGTVNFQNALHVAGTLTLRNGFITGSAAKTVAGVLAGNGAVVGDLTVDAGGSLAPGFSVGTMIFSNDLTLAGTYAVELSDMGGSGSADFIRVFGTLDISGATLSFTALDTTTNGVYVLARYGVLVGEAFATVSGMPAEFTLDYNYNNLNEIALITTIPEPSAAVLVGCGLVGLWVVRRRRR